MISIFLLLDVCTHATTPSQPLLQLRSGRLMGDEVFVSLLLFNTSKALRVRQRPDGWFLIDELLHTAGMDR